MRPSAALFVAAIVAAAVSLAAPGARAGAQAAPAPAVPASDSASPLRRFGRAVARAAAARQRARDTDRYDDTFRKYSHRYFGPTFDWRYFKAQGIAESGLDAQARSWVGARGVMQLMPSTFREIQSHRSDLRAIDDPESNIAAGIMHDRYLWRLWEQQVPETERHRFMFASYNAGEGTIARACSAADSARFGHVAWQSIERVAPIVRRWRYRETLGYVRKIDSAYARMPKR